MSDHEEKVDTKEEVPLRRRDGEDEEDRKAAVEEEKRRRKEMLEKRKEEMKRKNERRADEKRRDEEDDTYRRKDDDGRKKKIDRDDDEDDLDIKKKVTKDKIKKKPIREDLVQNAVHFLNSPTVRNTPLAKKVAFMEKKGLTSAEIKEALRRATQSQEEDDEEPEQQVVPQRKVNRTAVAPRPPPGYNNIPPPPPPQGPSWRGIATAAALAVCVGGGVTYLAKNYVVPHIWPTKPQDDPVNQAIKELKDQMAQITQNSTDLREAITALTTNTQQQQMQQLVQQQVQQQLQQQQPKPHAPPPTASQWNHDYDVLQPPSIQDEKDKENAELKAQVAALKATLIARQSATSVPPYPSSSHALNWSPAEHASTIPAWQQKALSSPSTRAANNSPTPSHTQPPIIQPLHMQQSQSQPQTPPQNRSLQPSTPPRPQTPQQQPQQPSPQLPPSSQLPPMQQQQQNTTTPQQQQQQQQAETSHPYSSAFNDVLQLVSDKNIPKEELHRRLNIRDINDKPVGNVPITKGDKQAVRKPWERNNTTTSTTSYDSHENSGEEGVKTEEKEDREEKEKSREREGDHAQEAVDHSSEVEVHEPPTHV